MLMDVAQVERTSNVKALASGKLTIDSEGMGVVMSILSGMYENSALAVLREYACNALDSHTTAGQTRPVEVSLPTDLQPTLVIKDYGTGLSQWETIHVFGTYAASTKRADDKSVGMFGIGAKSAFTIGHQFIVTAVKDAKKTVTLFSLNEDNEPVYDVVRSTDTDEPNGVTISLAVENVAEMRSNADYLFAFWDRGTVLVDGVEPTPVWERENVTQMTDRVYLSDNNMGNITVVMGPVPYILSTTLLLRVANDLKRREHPAYEQALVLAEWASQRSVFFKVEKGTCSVAPNRETLRDTKKTIAALESLLEEIDQYLSDEMAKEVKEAGSALEAARVLHEREQNYKPFQIDRARVVFGEVALTNKVYVGLPYLHLDKDYVYRRGYVDVVKQRNGRDTTVPEAGKSVVVTGVPADKIASVSRSAKRFLNEFDEGIYKRIYVSEEPTGAFGWFQYGVKGGVRTFTLKEYREALRTLSANNPRTNREPSYTTGYGSYEANPDGRDLLSDILDEEKDLLVFTQRAHSIPLVLLPDVEEHFNIVVLTPQQSHKALNDRVAADGRVRVVPHDEFRDWLSTRSVTELEKVTDEQWRSVAAHQWLSDNREQIHSWEYRVQILKEQTPTGREDVVITNPAFEALLLLMADAERAADSLASDKRDRILSLQQELPEATKAQFPIPDYGISLTSLGEMSPVLHYAFRSFPTWRLVRNEHGVWDDFVKLFNAIN